MCALLLRQRVGELGGIDRFHIEEDLAESAMGLLLLTVERVLQDLALLRNDRFRLHYLIGILHELDGNLAAALVSYRRTLRLNPYDARLVAHVAKLEKR